MSETSPILQIDGALASITLNRPQVANRLSPEDLIVLREHIEKINATEDILVAVFRASGRYFCSGYDISEVIKSSQVQGQSFGEMVDAIENCRAVTVASLQGGVYGGATDLALACDFRVGSLSTEMFMPAAKLGLHFYQSGLARFVTRLGPDVTRKLFLTGQKLDANAMFACGFLTQAPSADLGECVSHLCDTLQEMSPIALLGMKRFINQIAHGQVDRRAMANEVHRSIQSQDIAEGVAAWAEKRKPVFTGR